MVWARRTISLFLFAACASAQTPDVADGGVLNSASFVIGQVVTQGSLVSVFGSNLASTIAQPDSIPLSTSLANVTVTFNNIPAPLSYVSPNLINAQLPWNTLPDGVTQGTATVVVTANGVSSAPKQVPIGPFSPGIYAVNNKAIAINPDGTLALPPGALPPFTSRPAKPGDFMIILGTGLGALDSPLANGTNSRDKLRNVITPPVILVNGMTAPFLFAGISPDFVGVYQVNAIVPSAAGSGDTLPLQFQVGGITSPDTTTMAIAAQ
ncbi:MAG: hypothetical protein IT165_36285 [Bryobacterales bacterium]|nr:hypothetical protein [Bryobacterales bacterium]